MLKKPFDIKSLPRDAPAITPNPPKQNLKIPSCDHEGRQCLKHRNLPPLTFRAPASAGFALVASRPNRHSAGRASRNRNARHANIRNATTRQGRRTPAGRHERHTRRELRAQLHKLAHNAQHIEATPLPTS